LNRKARLTLKRVWGNAGDTLTAKACVLDYFIVIGNKSSCLSMVDYWITKINRFLRKGWRKGVRQVKDRPVNIKIGGKLGMMNSASLPKETCCVMR
jgi:hypothetical protein